MQAPRNMRKTADIAKHGYTHNYKDVKRFEKEEKMVLVSFKSQHARPPCPSQTPGVYSDSCPLSQ